MDRTNLPIEMMMHVPDYRLEPFHRHSMLEIGCCLKGEGIFHFGHKSYPIKPGDLFVVNPVEPHRAQSDPDQPAQFLFAFFEPSIWLHTDNELLLPFLYRPEGFENRIPASAESTSGMKEALLTMWNEYSRREPGFSYMLKGHLMNICASLLRYYNPSPDRLEASNVLSAYRTLRPVIQFLEQQYHDALTVNDVSSLLHLSPSRTQALFREAVGMGFSQYLRSVRVHAAKNLLIRTSLPVTEICQQSGFQSQAAFYRAFEDQVGMKPSDYRNQLSGIFS
ncbi:AraC family transcriptional regulator [Paenibacillus qinlingensis]|uniref:AraC family transcriptional regulator n=1 Tax=Paenibacillus qinlingensis TaxID=1837343 RepID=UPI0015653005|nr:AraC family transcriptional regulator [Paenibacillus qinlingensis]NQX64065.1 helix-turn-helix domain-containing protein [Paenibacillus qinlingensis]